jgi:hypothetical protein
MTDNNETDLQRSANDPDGREASNPAPVYEKPVLRKYDQIEQVKPYGPSELEAG